MCISFPPSMYAICLVSPKLESVYRFHYHLGVRCTKTSWEDIFISEANCPLFSYSAVVAKLYFYMTVQGMQEVVVLTSCPLTWFWYIHANQCREAMLAKCMGMESDHKICFLENPKVHIVWTSLCVLIQINQMQFWAFFLHLTIQLVLISQFLFQPCIF